MKHRASLTPSNLPLLYLFFFAELHSVHPAVHLRPADMDGEPVHLCLRLLQRRDHRQVVQAVCPAERTGAGGGALTQTNPHVDLSQP